jgi:hypothetical protein
VTRMTHRCRATAASAMSAGNPRRPIGGEAPSLSSMKVRGNSEAARHDGRADDPGRWRWTGCAAVRGTKMTTPTTPTATIVTLRRPANTNRPRPRPTPGRTHHERATPGP